MSKKDLVRAAVIVWMLKDANTVDNGIDSNL